MKKALSVLLLFVFAVSMQAQTTNSKFVKAMEKALAVLDTATTYEHWLDASNNFERISLKETKEWLPAYYVALCQTMAFNLSKDAEKQELFAKKAQEFVDKADKLQPDNSEIYVLKIHSFPFVPPIQRALYFGWRSFWILLRIPFVGFFA